MNKEYLISNRTALHLYEYARTLPIIDYHNHLSMADLQSDRRFTDIHTLWIEPDPYKHRAMRMFNGIDFDTYFKYYPNQEGYFGRYGGVYVDDELKAAMAEITEAYFTICKSRKFIAELRRIRKEFQGRPTPISHLERLSNKLGNVQLYVKREDLNHTGAHKLNHCMGEALLAKYMGKKKVIAETGAGQHGVALATAAAYFGLECDIYMGSVDIKKQAPNVARMKILGANVVEVTEGLQTLKEAVDAAFAAYAREYKDAIYCIGSVLGPHPFPMMVRDFQHVVARRVHTL